MTTEAEHKRNQIRQQMDELEALYSDLDAHHSALRCCVADINNLIQSHTDLLPDALLTVSTNNQAAIQTGLLTLSLLQRITAMLSTLYDAESEGD